MADLGGRPTVYSQDMVEKAKQYLATYEKDSVIPSIAGLALYLDLSRSTVNKWANEPDKGGFSDIVGKILIEQEAKLLNSGLNGDFNSSITKLILTKHGYSDKQDMTSSDGSMSPSQLTADQLDHRLKTLMEKDQ